MNEEIKIVIKAVTDSAKKNIKEVSGELESLSKSAKGSSGKIGAAFKGIAKGAAIAVAAIAAVVTAIVSLGKSTLEYQKEQAKLITGFQAMGSSAEQASETYNQLYRFLGKSDVAVEAANHLAKITTNQKNLAEWTKIAQGVYATFGDSLPIEGLTESANETLRVGKVTGSLADALNWAGVSEDAFNEKLAQTITLEEREALLRDTLNGLYSDAANIYERNNAALLAYNESQARLDATMGEAGAATLPLLTALNNLGNALMTALKPALDVIIPILTTFVNAITRGVEAVMSFFSALTGKESKIKAVSKVGGDAAKSLGAASTGAKNFGSNLGGAGKAAGSAAKAIEEAKRSTQGFDELNIVSSGTTSSGGSGGGGGSSSPGYASGGGSGGGITDSAEFETEIEETDSVFSGFFDNISKELAEFTNLFAPSISAWSDAFETVKEAWNNAKPDFIDGANEIKIAWEQVSNYMKNDFVPNMVNTFSTNIAPVIGDIAGFIVQEIGSLFSWLGTQIKIQTDDIAIPGLERVKTTSMDTFNIIGEAWKKHGQPLMESFSKFFENLRTHFDKFYNSFLLPIWNKILAVFDKVWTEGLKPLTEKFVNGIMEIVTELNIFYNEVLAPIINWIIDNVVPVITTVVNFIVDIIGSVIIFISDVIGGVIDIIKGVIKFITGVFTGDWEKAWQGVCDIFSGIWDIIVGIFDFIVNLLEDIITFICDLFVELWDLIVAVWDQAVGFFEGIWNGICDVFWGVVDWFGDIFTQAWDAVCDAWDSVTDWFSDIWDGICDIFSGVGDWFGDIFSQAWDAVCDAFNGIGDFFSGIWNTIKDTFSALGTKISDSIGGAVKKGINGVISGVETIINKAIGLINSAIGLINEIPGVNIGKIGKVKFTRLAKGGIVDTATFAMIGEAGKEAVVPLENNTEWMDKLAAKLSDRNSAPSKIVLTLDGRELGWANINSINSITKQTGSLQLQLV